MATNIKSYPNLIDGTWKTLSDVSLEDRNPADYNEIIGLFPMATLDDTKSAIQAARSAFPAWSKTPAWARGAILDKASQMLSTRGNHKYFLNAPFGGFKQSSANAFKEQGQAAADFYTRMKTIYVNHA